MSEISKVRLMRLASSGVHSRRPHSSLANWASQTFGSSFGRLGTEVARTLASGANGVVCEPVQFYWWSLYFGSSSL